MNHVADELRQERDSTVHNTTFAKSSAFLGGESTTEISSELALTCTIERGKTDFPYNSLRTTSSLSPEP